MKHLKKFNTATEYDQFKSGSEFILPNVSFVVDNGVKFNPNVAPLVYNMVDLGLPSGLLWADRNVGAQSPEDYGLYFQWGDTVGYTADQVGKDKVFNWSNYWDSVDGSDYNFNKYATDKLTVLEASDNAASVNMGSDWRMPTKAELTEFIKNTNRILIDKNGNEISSTTSGNCKGIKFVSKTNGNSIFIPASGVCDESALEGTEDGCLLWSSDLVSSFSGYARYLYFNFGRFAEVRSGDRYLGMPVRGVCNK